MPNKEERVNARKTMQECDGILNHLFLFSSVFAFSLCRLALYVYEYLLHVGAQKSAQTFLSEVRAASCLVWIYGNPSLFPLYSLSWNVHYGRTKTSTATEISQTQGME